MLFTWKGNPYDIDHVKQRLGYVIQNRYEIIACTDLFIIGKIVDEEVTYQITLGNKKEKGFRKSLRFCFYQLNKHRGEKHHEDMITVASYDNKTYLGLLKERLDKYELRFWTYILFACFSVGSLVVNINSWNNTLFFIARIIIFLGAVTNVFLYARDIIFITKILRR